MRVAVAALTLGLLLAATGCGGDDDASADPTTPTSSSAGDGAGDGGADGRPTAAEVADGLQESSAGDQKGYTEKEATCIAEVMLASELSDDSLRQIAEDLAGFVPTGDQEAVYRDLFPQLTPCLLDRMTAPTP